MSNEAGEYPNNEDLAPILFDLTLLLKENKTILQITAEDVLHDIKNKKLPEAINRLNRFVKKTNLVFAMNTLISDENNEEARKKLLFLAQVHNWSMSIDPDVISTPKDIQKQYYFVNSKPYHGIVLILNNELIKKKKQFKSNDDVNHSGMTGSNRIPERRGSSMDVKRLTYALTELNYEVHVREELTSNEMKGEIEDFLAKDEHKSCDAVGMVIMAHGGSGDVLYSVKNKDDKLTMSDVLRPFWNKNFPVFKKPKFLIIQTYVGYNRPPPDLPDDLLGDHSNSEKSSQSVISNYEVPPDMLVMHATSPEFLSFRHVSNESSFIQSLCDVMERHGKVTPMQRWFPLITKKNQDSQKSYDPNNVVALQFTSTLTKQFYLDTALLEDN